MTKPPEPMVDVPHGDIERGAELFKSKCASCHSIREGGPNKQGPPLFGVMGRAAGTCEGFEYSDAMVRSGIVWSDKHLWEYLVNPMNYVVGTNKIAGCMRREEDRANTIAYIKTCT